jgi:hypothetical protein
MRSEFGFTGQSQSGPPLSTFQLNPLLQQLSHADQADYLQLANFFAFCDDRNKRNLGMSTFAKHLDMIHSFVCRGDACDTIRGVVCGIEFGTNSFLLNTRELKRLMFRSKSCMNGCFQRLGYTVCRPSRDLPSLFAEIVPGCGSHFFTARQWCVRKAGAAAQVTFAPSTAVDFVGSSEPEESAPPVQETRGKKFDAGSAFLFDIHNLLNHPPPDAVIPRMAFAQLAPLRA